MSLAIGDVFETSCDECGATLQYRVDAQTLATFIGAPSSPVNLRLINRQTGATFGGCPHERNDCAGVTAALAPTAVPTGRSGHSRIGLVTAQPDIVTSGPG